MFVKHVMYMSVCLCATECKCMRVFVSKSVYMCFYMSVGVVSIFIQFVLKIKKIC